MRIIRVILQCVAGSWESTKPTVGADTRSNYVGSTFATQSRFPTQLGNRVEARVSFSSSFPLSRTAISIFMLEKKRAHRNRRNVGFGRDSRAAIRQKLRSRVSDCTSRDFSVLLKREEAGTGGQAAIARVVDAPRSFQEFCITTSSGWSLIDGIRSPPTLRAI